MDTVDIAALVDGFVRIGESLVSDESLAEQVTTICQTLTEVLGCERSSVMMWDGQHYRGKYNFGNPPDIARTFHQFKMGPDHRLIQALHKADRFLILNDPEVSQKVTGLANYARVNAAVVAPIDHPNGDSLGFITAEYNDQHIDQFDELCAMVVLSAAHLARRVIVADNRRQARIRDIASKRELVSSLARSEEAERSRASREIHDDSMQRLLAIRLKLGALAEQAEDPATAKELADLAQLGASTTSSLRYLLQNLHPRGLDDDGLATALTDALARYAVGTGWKCGVINRLTVEPPTEIEILLYRAALQALTCIEIHADAAEVSIDLTTENRGTQLTLKAQGRGLDPEALVRFSDAGTEGADRTTLRDRIEFTGGSVELRGPGDQSLEIVMWVPNQLQQLAVQSAQ